MWLAYLADAELVFDFVGDTNAAAYLSSYLKQNASRTFDAATLMIIRDDPDQENDAVASDVATFGLFHLHAVGPDNRNLSIDYPD
jgi:hypothetical protein